MKRNQPENKLVVNPILSKLKLLKLGGQILWYQRLVAEDDTNCPAGTPDIVAIVNRGDGYIGLLFIECKRPTGKTPSVKDLRFEQALFFSGMAGKPLTLCVVINEPSQLYGAIKKVRNL